MRELRSFFSSILRRLEGNDRAILTMLREMWPQIVGEDMARTTRPIRFEGHFLELGVENRVWAAPLQEMRPLIRNSINRMWGFELIERIDLKLEDLPSGKRQREKRRPAVDACP